jgi:dTMP kinase
MNKPPTARGRFITLEGGEGGGKSTQCRLLARWLADQGISALATREPGGSPGAERIRQLLVTGASDRWTPVTETLLHYAARRDHIDRTIEPALASGTWVVSDRFFDSTLAYQGYGHGVARDFIQMLRNGVVGAGLRPDLTVILDLPESEGLRRSQGRAKDEHRYESMAVEFHGRLRKGFLEIAGDEPDRCVVVDAQRDVEQVHGEITRLVAERLGVKART